MLGTSSSCSTFSSGSAFVIKLGLQDSSRALSLSLSLSLSIYLSISGERERCEREKMCVRERENVCVSERNHLGALSSCTFVMEPQTFHSKRRKTKSKVKYKKWFVFRNFFDFPNGCFETTSVLSEHYIMEFWAGSNFSSGKLQIDKGIAIKSLISTGNTKWQERKLKGHVCFYTNRI